MPRPESDRDQPVSLHGLDPEEALRALLAVQPDSAEHQDDEQGDDQAAGDQPDGEDDPAR